MKRSIWSIVAIAFVVVLYLAWDYWNNASDTIDYQGQQFKMSKTYWTYEDYKDDPNNLATNELSRIEAVIRGASIGTNFDTREHFIDAVFSLKFPGYGLEQFGEKAQPDGSSLSMFSVEIPQREKDRYLTARVTRAQYILVDDFIASSVSNAVSQVKLEGTTLRYYDAAGSLVREHRM